MNTMNELNKILTDKAQKYLEIVEKSFIDKVDYMYYIRWISNKIKSSNVLKQGLMIYDLDFKSFDIINDLKRVYSNLINDMYNENENKSRIVIINNLDDAKLWRIYSAYNLNECHDINGKIEKNEHDFIIYTNDLTLEHLKLLKSNFYLIKKVKLIRKSESDNYKYVDESLIIDDDYFDNYLNEEDIKSIYEYLLNY